jgi:uncharacterized Zn-finger protein
MVNLISGIILMPNVFTPMMGGEEDTSYDEFKCPHCGIVFKEYISK